MEHVVDEILIGQGTAEEIHLWRNPYALLKKTSGLGIRRCQFSVI